MKIDSISNIKKIEKKKVKSNSDNGFNDLVENVSSNSESNSASSASNINSVDSLFFLQELSYDSELLKKESRKSHKILDSLKNIQINLLSGNLSEENLLDLKSNLKKINKNNVDPELAQVVEDIELRSEIELAKTL